MVVVVVAIFAICWFPIQVKYLYIHYSCMVSFIFYLIPYKTKCTFYYVPDYESYTAQEACSRHDFRELRNSYTIQGRLDYRGKNGL